MALSHVVSRSRLAGAALVPLLAVGLSAQQEPPPKRPPLTYEALLEGGAALMLPMPSPLWVPGGHDAAFVKADGSALFRRSPGQPETMELQDAQRVLAAIGAPPSAPAAMPPCALIDAETLRLELPGEVWHLRLSDGSCERVLQWPAGLDARDDAPSIAFAAGDAAAAFVQGHDLHVLAKGGMPLRITQDGSPDLVYGGAAHRAEFGIHGGLFWSPDGKRLAFYREDLGPIAPYPYQDPLQTPPVARHGRYPMAGRAHSAVQVGVYDREQGRTVYLQQSPGQDLYWTNVTFLPDSQSLTVALVDRSQDRCVLARFDAGTGKRLETLFEEKDDEWIEPEHGPTFLPDGSFLWWSIRDGHRHLCLHQPDGALLRQVTKGAFDVQELLHVDAAGGGLWFTASGEDPRQLHLFHAPLGGGDARQVTRERGTHQCSISPDGKAAFAIWSNVETPPQARFVDLETGAVEPFEWPAAPILHFEPPQQRLFQVRAEDGAVLYGHAMMPPQLPADARLPALLYVYGGPHLQQVTDRWAGGASPWLQALANHGYVVCRLDNRGTPNRGIEFEQATFRRLGVLEASDQMRAVEWLRQQPFVDGDRIGVHGWSFGGYMTLRLMGLYPQDFRCGISGAPVTDWAMYETGYTERYMDTPEQNPDGYAASSCLGLAGAIRGRLLVVHGTDDRTVMWSHSLQFVDRCIDEGVLLDSFSYPNQTHRLVGKDRIHFQRLLKDRLDRWLKAD